jgi:hypothetical protein
MIRYRIKAITYYAPGLEIGILLEINKLKKNLKKCKNHVNYIINTYFKLYFFHIMYKD